MASRVDRLKKRKTKLATNIVKAAEAGKTKKASRAVARAERKAPKLKKKIANTKARVATRAKKKATKSKMKKGLVAPSAFGKKLPKGLKSSAIKKAGGGIKKLGQKKSAGPTYLSTFGTNRR